MKKIKCDKCKGEGWRNYPNGPDIYGDQSYIYKECEGCWGTGKVDDLTDEQKRDDRDMNDTIRREYGL